MASICPTTPFEVYISKIKAGLLKNSCDEAFDQKTHVHSQTISSQNADSSNQCPQDYQVGHAYQHQQDKAADLEEFLLKLAPVVE